MKDVKFYDTGVCPYAHRNRLVMHEKGVKFDLVKIDVSSPPDWFLKLSPAGKVPLLESGEDVVTESTVINEYLEDRVPEPALLPKDAGARAKARMWVEYGNAAFLPPLLGLLFGQDNDKRKECAAGLEQSLLHIEQEAMSGPGPYWMGNDVSLVDFAFYPFFERFPVLEHYRGFTMPASCKNIEAWMDVMQGRDSVSHNQVTPEKYIKEFAHLESQ